MQARAPPEAPDGGECNPWLWLRGCVVFGLHVSLLTWMKAACHPAVSYPTALRARLYDNPDRDWWALVHRTRGARRKTHPYACEPYKVAEGRHVASQTGGTNGKRVAAERHGNPMKKTSSLSWPSPPHSPFSVPS